MHNEYREAVREHYLQLVESGNISPKLIKCSPARLKYECMDLFKNENLNILDYRTIKDFLNISFREVLYYKDLSEVPVSKFRPISNFLRGVKNPNESTLEMAAFLIDFRPRPFTYFYKMKCPDSTDSTNPYLNQGISDADPERKTDLFLEEFSIKALKKNMDSSVIPMEPKKEDIEREDQSFTVIRDNLLGNNDLAETVSNKEIPIMVEYPSGVRLIVKAADLAFISELIKL
ncbi:hypothetical protein CEQ15_11350 [Chryseobacterium indologenes]|uniref:hypothetical protein n=1 Tax=Chryseobacterium indologenes TaxID=253 RepID=UPI000B51A608|nr:hypothetical protein [Chryseobacterium indologenes]ASE62044.1 hypothetical protein CEQ15_11350 [Chryseobacterium indologenes]